MVNMWENNFKSHSRDSTLFKQEYSFNETEIMVLFN